MKYSVLIYLLLISVSLSYATEKYKKYNLGDSVNSKYDELGPLISHDGKILYFIRSDHPENIGSNKLQDIWYSELIKENTWSKAKSLGYPLNNEFPNFISSICAGGNSLLLGNTYNRDGTIGQGLSITYKTKYGWSFPENFEIENYYNLGKYASFNMSASGKVLLLAIQRKDGFGKEDIYISFKISDHRWTEPKNIGPVINSSESDFSPFLASDDATLYFSSFGHDGIGDADLFLTRRLDSTWLNWSEPKNLGTLINTEQGEGYLSIDASGEWAYFVSLENSIGGSDIFKMRLPDSLKPNPVVLVSGKVIPKGGELPDSVNVFYERLPQGVLHGCTRINPITGDYSVVLPAGYNYGLWADALNFTSQNENLDTRHIKAFTEVQMDLHIIPVETGSTMVMNNLFFDFDKATIKSESYPELNRIAQFLKDNPEVSLLLSGHTDSFGTELYNQKLSERRAKAVVDYFITKGIATERLEYLGYGESKPVANNKTEKNRKKNRRVEFEIKINKK
jgi:OmpA-OmpF porin, OOP family